MKNMKKIAALMLAVLALSGAAVAGERLKKVLEAGELVVCTEPYFAPYEFLDNTKTGQDYLFVIKAFYTKEPVFSTPASTENWRKYTVVTV